MNNKSLAVIFIHGMGNTDSDFCEGTVNRLKTLLGKEKSKQVHFDSIYYAKVLQDHQDALFEKYSKISDLKWMSIREFMLYSISDAATLSKKIYDQDRPYMIIERLIQNKLEDIYQKLAGERKHVIIAAYSLGAHVISNYIYDAQHNKGIFTDTIADPNDPKDCFLRLKTLQYLVTFGCNIPILVGGIPETKITPIQTSENGYSISWFNYYDKDDVLGWPLKPLNDAYKHTVKFDIEINVGGPLESWTPLSHRRYWEDDDFVRPLAGIIKSIL